MRTKSIKFVDHPSCEHLGRQLEMINNNLHFIVQHDGNLDLMLTINEHNVPATQIDTTTFIKLPDVLPLNCYCQYLSIGSQLKSIKIRFKFDNGKNL